jgi:hypothetical protein
LGADPVGGQRRPNSSTEVEIPVSPRPWSLLDQGDIRFHPFDPDSGLIPGTEEFGPLIERSEGRGIVLIAVPHVETAYWCAEAAAALVTTWSAQGARILLADVSLVRPVLHEVFDLPNSEGVSDVIVSGAQFRTVCRQIGSPGFLFMSTGETTEDVADVLSSDRWDIVIKALEEADVTLVTYAPADIFPDWMPSRIGAAWYSSWEEI